jgi:hypothetical protein
LDDLKIIDIARKPQGLSADLKASADFANKEEAFESLGERGFYLAQLKENGPVELFSNEGEFRVVMKDGVEYVLRFGGIAGAGSTKSDDKEQGKEKGGEKDQKKSAGLNRYLLVMAEFNPDIIPKPQLEAIPEAKKDAEAKPAEEKKSEGAKPEEKVSEEPKPEAAKPEEKKADEKKPEDKAAEGKKADDAKKAGDDERQRIEKENKRKQDEYDQKVTDGKKHVADLNARFADWYYVISDEVFRKIHLGRDELVKKKEPPKAQGDEKKDEHAGHEHEAMPQEPTPPAAEPEKPSAEPAKPSAEPEKPSAGEAKEEK